MSLPFFMMTKVGIDIRGGDHAPHAILEGLHRALPELKASTQVYLYGLVEDLQNLPTSCVAVPCPTWIGMEEHPVKAFQQKPQSTLVQGFKDLAQGKIDSFASAGHSGALMVGAMQVLGVIKGFSRPAVISLFPKLDGGQTVVLDVGINVDAKAEQFIEFARLGTAYAQSVLGIKNPRVALLNTGTEASKGNILYQKAHQLLLASTKGFVGNIEARDLYNPEADVLVCDGFTGNMVLKQTEAFFSLSEELKLKHSFLEGLNYEKHGASPVLGVQGKVLLAHGASGPEAIKNMILSSESFALASFVEQISAPSTI
jgi:glycerol-3-phosphate acyltransferase PlsX